MPPDDDNSDSEEECDYDDENNEETVYGLDDGSDLGDIKVDYNYNKKHKNRIGAALVATMKDCSIPILCFTIVSPLIQVCIEGLLLLLSSLNHLVFENVLIFSVLIICITFTKNYVLESFGELG